MYPVKVKVDESVNNMRFEQKVKLVEEVLQHLSISFGERALRFAVRSHLREKGYRVIHSSILLALISDVKISD